MGIHNAKHGLLLAAALFLPAYVGCNQSVDQDDVTAAREDVQEERQELQEERTEGQKGDCEGGAGSRRQAARSDAAQSGRGQDRSGA